MRRNKFLGALSIVLTLLVSCENGTSDSELLSNGQGGSMARFAIAGDYLYIVAPAAMQLFEIAEPENPIDKGKIDAGFNIETIFHYQSNLFLGTQNGMYIYDLHNPAAPQLLSIYEHITSCDPVVAQGNYAYVTMRNGVSCRFGQNQMDIVDITNLKQPRRLSSTSMFNPHGLAISDTLLYVCEGERGLKVLNVKDPLDVKEVAHIRDIFGYDVIIRDSLMMVTGGKGVFQYNLKSPQAPELLSEIRINRLVTR